MYVTSNEKNLNYKTNNYKISVISKQKKYFSNKLKQKNKKMNIKQCDAKNKIKNK